MEKESFFVQRVKHISIILQVICLKDEVTYRLCLWRMLTGHPFPEFIRDVIKTLHSRDIKLSEKEMAEGCVLSLTKSEFQENIF